MENKPVSSPSNLGQASADLVEACHAAVDLIGDYLGSPDFFRHDRDLQEALGVLEDALSAHYIDLSSQLHKAGEFRYD